MSETKRPENNPTERPNTKGFLQIMTIHKAQNSFPNQSSTLLPISEIRLNKNIWISDSSRRYSLYCPRCDRRECNNN